ncbi:MAG: glycosyltransferase family 4 protein [Candidatus Aminicenantes bacterium]|nr:glycosyltransferase family 4 protein [Candidatus Aminicenantes bacterium]
MLAISLAVAFGALGISTLCVAGARCWAVERMLDIPNARSSHTQPTPRGGGLGIVIGVFIGAGSLFIFRILSMPFREIAAISLGGGIVALVGWLDDIHRLPYSIRLVVQGISSAIILVAIGYFHTITVPFVGDIHLYSIGIPFALVWIVGLTNAYNFMDGIDGIAGGQALIAGLGWVIIGFMSGQSFVGLIGLLLAASSLGFLFHNWPPARIFMGDVGSAFIGFTLAVLPIIGGQRDPRFMIAGILLVWPFVFDTSFTLARRMIRKENIFEAHRSHIYQRLVIAGYNHRFVTLIYMGLALIGTFIALLWYKRAPFVNVAVIVLPILLFVGLWRFAIRAESRAHSGA